MNYIRYNPRTDRVEAHIAVSTGKGVYHMDIPVTEGRSFRQDKADALAAINKAIRSGKPPGKVA